MVWQAISLLRSVPEAPRTTKRFEGDCKAFTDYSDYRDSGGLPQRKRDNAIGAARRLSWLEHALAEFESDMAFDDRFVLADRRSAGEAFAGTVVEADPGRTVTTDKNRRVPRPRVTVRTEDPVRLAADTKLISPSLPAGHKAMIVSVLPDGDTTRVTVEITGGMGRGRVPKQGTVPEPGQRVAYLPDPGWRPSPQFPASDATPWTHSAADESDTDSAVPEDAAAEEWGNED